jgi:hypothetical protein
LKSFNPPPPKEAGADKLNAPGGTNMDMNKMMVGRGQPGAGGTADTKKTKNGLNSDRYIEQPTAEVRKVPFGISLIVGQEHIDRVLFAFSKSPLRILMTQVIVDRYPHSVRPTGMEQAPQGIAGGNPLGGGLGGRMGFPGGDGNRGYGSSGYGGNPGGGLGGRFGGFGGFGGGLGGGLGGTRQGSGPATGGADSQETNVEMVIYGIAPLYQRYPPRPPEAAAPVTQ